MQSLLCYHYTSWMLPSLSSFYIHGTLSINRSLFSRGVSLADIHILQSHRTNTRVPITIDPTSYSSPLQPSPPKKMSNTTSSNQHTDPPSQKDKLIALTAVLSTLSLATLDLKASSQILKDPPPSKLVSSLPHHVNINLPKSPVLIEGVAHSYARAFTAGAFFYLAYKDYQAVRGLQSRGEGEGEEGQKQEWRCKVWAGCGAVGVLLQSLRPLPGGVSGVFGGLGQKEGVEGQARRLGMLSMAKGVGLMATVPFCLGAWRSM